MLSNRFIPAAHVIPVLAYADAQKAADWLRDAFGFTVRIIIRGHRVQMNVGTGAIIVREFRPGEHEARRGIGCSVTIRIEDVDAHYARALDHGALIVQEPSTYPYGERQYTATDCGGYSWTFSQTVADVHPEEWGGIAVEL